ncbi:MAG: glycosyltransferase family 2 protein [Lachnospiraceae bacterium]|nr:glycosyltransferase family 2 protein [Lachnospiraceae bacterium]
MLLSIIIPVYNVEKYLGRCVRSVVAALPDDTEYEVLLIDDGSTDSSGELCDALCDQYSCVVTVHKANGGLSDARNTGLRMAKGKYVGFIDSDDFWLGNVVEAFQSCLQKYPDVDIFHFGYQETYDDEQEKVDTSHVEDWEKFDKVSAFQDYLCGEHQITRMAWDKIYKRSLFEGVEYPRGYLAEDYGCTYRLLMKAEVIVRDPAPYYGYFQRGDSIMRTKSAKLIMDEYQLGCLSFRECYDFPAYRNLRTEIVSDLVYLTMKTYVRLQPFREQPEAAAVRKAATHTCRKHLLSHTFFRTKVLQVLFLFARPLYTWIITGKGGTWVGQKAS